jgi:predicted transcriptional regulator YdeE
MLQNTIANHGGAMQHRIISKDEFQIVGLELRTSQATEADPLTRKIGPAWDKFFSENIIERIPNKIEPGVFVGLYSNYKTGDDLEYSVTIGALVEHARQFPEFLTARIVPANQYAVFTTEKGAMPEVVISAWKKIWQMSPTEIGGERALNFDFEIYDQRSADPKNATVDIYIALK